MMRIAHYERAIRLELGGATRAVLDMCAYQASAGCDVTLLTCDDTDVPESWKRGGPGLPKLACLSPPGLLAGLERRLRRQLDAVIRRCDVVHLHGIWDPVQLSLASVARRNAKPYIQTPNGTLADWSMAQKRVKKSVYFALAGARLLERAAFVHAAAQAELDQARKRHPRTPSVVIPLVFDLAPYRELPGPGLARTHLRLPSPELPSLLFLSRLHYKKRPDLLIKAAGVLRDMGLKFSVVIAGPGEPDYERALRALARKLGLGDRTTFLGMVPEALKASLYQACDLLVLPTSMENFGFVYFESLACGTPVVTTKGSDTWEDLLASGGARIVDLIKSDCSDGVVGNGDVSELVRAIGELIHDRPRLKHMGFAGRQWVLQHLDPSRVVPQYISLYERALAGATVV